MPDKLEGESGLIIWLFEECFLVKEVTASIMPEFRDRLLEMTSQMTSLRSTSVVRRAKEKEKK